MIELRAYQWKGVNGVKHAYANGKRRVLLVIPTGGGKTIIFSYVAMATVKNARRVMVLAHRIELLEQCGDKMELFGVPFGYISPRYTPNHSAPVQVGSMQTIIRRLEVLKFKPDLIIVDEAHRAMSKTYQAILAHYSEARVLGVTATPIRGDGKPLSEFFDDMIVGPTVQQLIDLGHLVNPITYAPLDQLDLTGVKVVKTEDGYDYSKKDLVKKLDTPGVTGDAVKHYRKYADKLPAVAFCVSVTHAQHVAADFRAAGYVSEHIDGDMSTSERKRILGGLKNGTIHVVTSVDLITEGFDAPMLIVAIMLRPTKLLGQYLQMAGRVLRPFEGKNFCIILDHAGCTLRHGLITEDQEWSLEAEQKKKRKKGDKEPLIKVKQCPKCYAMHKPLPACPRCGYEYIIIGREPDQKDGELTQVTAQSAAIIKQQKRKMVASAETLEDLKQVAKILGYSEKWAAHVLNGRNQKAGLV